QKSSSSTHACRLPGTISGSCWALVEPGPSAEIHRTIKLGERPDFIGTGVATSPTPSAALRYWNMARQRYCRRLALSETPSASLPTRSPSQPRTAARKAEVLDTRKQLGERDRLSAGGNRIRTIGPA